MFSLIVATAQNRVIGKNNSIPWHITEDYLRTKKITWGHPIIMGKNNFESISGFKAFKGSKGKKPTKLKILPGRTNIVLAEPDYKVPPKAKLACSIEESLKIAKKSPGAEEIFIFGGASIYAQFLEKNLVDKLYITFIDEEIKGDVYFPKVDWKKWKRTKNLKRIIKVGKKEINYYFREYLKKIPN